MKTTLLLGVFFFSPLWAVAQTEIAPADSVRGEVQSEDPEAGRPEVVPPTQETEEVAVPVETSPRKKPNFVVGLARENFLYREPGLMSDRSVLTGINLQLLMPTTMERARVKGVFDYVSGTGTYDGQTMSGIPLTANTVNYVINLKGTIAGALFTNDFFLFELFGGLGVRALANNQSGPGSYRREITYTYLPMGVSGTVNLGAGFSFALHGEYDFFAGGTVKTHLSDASSSLPDLENTQRTGRGQRLSGVLTKDFSKFSGSIEYYTQSWSVEDSNIVYVGTTGFYEPKNETTISGVSVSVTF